MIPENIGKYRTECVAGTGAYGTVYRAHDPSMNRVVAIKLISSQADPAAIDRFKNEAMTAGGLRHRNIVTVYDFGEDAGVPYLVMEFLEGHDFEHIIGDGMPLSLFEKVDAMLQVAQGLNCAHERGILHRDVKPANLMRLQDGTVKIMDFGIARLSRTDRQHLTQTGFIIGTPAYMAPEQFAGTIDALTDIWAFGIVCCELLTGVNPVRRPGVFGMGGTPSDISELLSERLPLCPDALRAVVCRLTAVNRDERYQSLEDVVLDLEPIRRALTGAEIDQLAGNAASLIERSELAAAQILVRRILGLDSTHPQARRWRDELRESAKRLKLQPQLDDLLRSAEVCAVERQFRAAVDKIEQALRLDPTNSFLRSRLLYLQQLEAKQQEGARLMRLALNEFERGEITQAMRLVGDAEVADAGNPDASKLLSELERAKAERDREIRIRTVLGKAKSLILMQSYDEAIRLLTSIDSDDPEVAAKLAEAWKLKQEQDRLERVSAAIGKARSLMNRSKYQEAIRVLRHAQGESPGDVFVRAALDDAIRGAAAADQAAKADVLFRSAAEAFKRKEYDAVWARVEEGLAVNPEHHGMRQLKAALLEGDAAEQRFQPVHGTYEPPIDAAEILDSRRKMRVTESVPAAAEMIAQRDLAGAGRRRPWAGIYILAAATTVIAIIGIIVWRTWLGANSHLVTQGLTGGAPPAPAARPLVASPSASLEAAKPVRREPEPSLTVQPSSPSTRPKTQRDPAPPSPVSVVSPARETPREQPSSPPASRPGAPPATATQLPLPGNLGKVEVPAPAPEPVINCHDASYRGLRRAEIKFGGVIPPDQTVTITRSNQVTVTGGGSGSVKGSRLPGCEVDVAVLSPVSGVELEEAPALANSFGMIRIRNRSGSDISNVVVQWIIK